VSVKFLYSLARSALFSLDPESAHDLTLGALRHANAIGLTTLLRTPSANPSVVMGLTFPNQIGLAAGLDKDGTCIDGLASLGFGSIEVGTVTPRAQSGNAKPRMFRLPSSDAIINRMGFNNAGVDAFVRNIRASKFYQDKRGVLGLNIGKNADTPIERAVEDYLYCFQKIYRYADYITINISSPNTRNLRKLQGALEIDNLLLQLKGEQQKLSDKHKRYVPVVLKIAPDIDSEQIKVISSALIRHKVDGVIATNTSISREKVKNLQYGEEDGGLSGKPLLSLSNSVIAQLHNELGNAIPIIGVGGILSGTDAQSKINAGAKLIQLYSGLIYRGPELVLECANSLSPPDRV
jgi:dihydroorotate dehydrogenase